MGQPPAPSARRTRDSRRACASVNRVLLPAKLTYALGYTALAAWTPFFPIFAASQGLQAREVGVLKLLMPLMTVVAQPLWARLADTRTLHKEVMVGSMAVGSVVRACVAAAGLLPSPAGAGSGADASEAFTSARFWCLAGLVVASELLAAGFMPLVDASVVTVLAQTGSDVTLYGRQRAWGAVGWGISTVIWGAVIDATNEFAIFVIYSVFAVMAVVSASKLPVSTKPLVGSWGKAVSVLLRSWAVVAVLLLAMCLGWLAGVISTFLFLFLEDLGARAWLMGLTLTVTCVAEVPVFFVSGSLIRRLGNLGVIALAFACFMVRNVWYSALYDPFWVLPVELLHGITFGAAWAACTNFGAQVAPPGLEATTQSIMSATKMGLGFGVGALAGGIVYSSHGPRDLFRTAAVVATVGLALALALIVGDWRYKWVSAAGRSALRTTAPRAPLAAAAKSLPASPASSSSVPAGGDASGCGVDDDVADTKFGVELELAPLSPAAGGVVRLEGDAAETQEQAEDVEAALLVAA